ncbi:MAG: hypothetical protein NC236_02320 [Mycoplasma sp.]|nr:hypothetical protein [Mycoplasma sp.]
MSSLFKISTLYHLSKISNVLNSKNIEFLSKKEINKILEEYPRDFYEWYLNKTLKKYYEDNYELNWVFYKKFNKILKKIKIDFKEIRVLEEIIFTKERPLKILDTTLKLNENEKAYARFYNAKLFSENYFKTFKRQMIGELLITNQRIIIYKNEDENYTFKFTTLFKKKHRKEGFEFVCKKKKYLLKIHNQTVLNITLQRLFEYATNNKTKKGKKNVNK